MQKIVIVNNNMHLGGVQKSLLEFIKMIHNDYDISLILFGKVGELVTRIPDNVKITEIWSLYHCFGVSQNECSIFSIWYYIRGIISVMFKILGRRFIMPLINASQPQIKEEFNFAISFSQNADEHLLYGGSNDFVLNKINASHKITFVHCDYQNSGTNNRYNNFQYYKFDKIAACSDGCRTSFLSVLPDLESKTYTVVNCYDYEQIKQLANENPVKYSNGYINLISVARLAAEKGIDRGIIAVSKHDNVMYHIVGDGPQYQFLVELVKKLNIENRVKFYGNQINPYRYMLNADALLIPSFHEAAPLVIDEARCLNLPIISTLTTSSCDMIVNKLCGWVCENTQDGLNTVINSLDNEKISDIKHLMTISEVNNNLFKTQFRKILEND